MATLNEISNAFYEFSYHKYTEELKNSDKPDQKEEFPSRSVFLNDFQEKVNNVYHELDRNYPPEQAKYIYETFIANLNRQSQNPGQSRIINSSKGTINVENLKGYSKKVEETLKVRHPEKFEVKEAKIENKKLAEVTEKKVDFSNPEEKKAYFQNLFTEYRDLKTEKEKEEFKRSNFADYEEYREEIDSTFDYKMEMIKLEEERPEMSESERSKQACENIGKTKEEMNINDRIFEISAMIEDYNKQLVKIEEKSAEYQKLKKQIDNLKSERTQLKQEKNNRKDKNLKKIPESKQETDNIKNCLNENTKNDDLEKILSGAIKEERENEDFNENYIEPKSDLDELLEANFESMNTYNISETFQDINRPENIKGQSTHYNPILGQVGEKELHFVEEPKQETSLIEYKLNRLKVFLSNLVNKIKESNFFKKITSKNQNNKVENENNILKLEQIESERKTFNDSLIVSVEEQEKNRIKNEKNNPKRSASISILMGERGQEN